MLSHFPCIWWEWISVQGVPLAPHIKPTAHPWIPDLVTHQPESDWNMPKTWK